MRLVIQRVQNAAVSIAGKEEGRIGPGLLVLCGVAAGDTLEDVEWLVQKTVQMRLFADSEGKMNRSVQEVEGGVLVISQFTLHASTRKGNRPSFLNAARPEMAIPLYEAFLERLEALLGRAPERGRFGADMQVSLVNDGPVTLVIDSRLRE